MVYFKKGRVLAQDGSLYLNRVFRSAFLISRSPAWVSCQPSNLTTRTISSMSATTCSTMIGVSLFFTSSNSEFLEGFTDFTNAIPLKTIRPAISTVVYQTKCAKWNPENFRAGIPAIDGRAHVYETINEKEHTLVVITARRVSLDWTDVEKLFSWQWELYVVIWSAEQNLLFINSSTNAGEYKALAGAVAGRDAAPIKGQQVFRTFAGVNRLRLQNVGLTEQLGRNIRYTGRMGADVESGLTDLQRQRARKSVLSGRNGALKFAIASESARIEVELELFEENESPNYRFVGGCPTLSLPFNRSEWI